MIDCKARVQTLIFPFNTDASPILLGSSLLLGRVYEASSLESTGLTPCHGGTARHSRRGGKGSITPLEWGFGRCGSCGMIPIVPETKGGVTTWWSVRTRSFSSPLGSVIPFIFSSNPSHEPS